MRTIDEQMNGYIYIIKNTCNNKVYVGQTSRTIEDRWSQHKNAALRGDDYGTILYRAMRKHGIENFYVEQLEECNMSDINDREIYWIKYYNCQTPNGYNIRAGGEDPGRKEVYKLDNDGNIIKHYSSAMAASETNNLDLSSLTKACRRSSSQNSCGGYKWAYVEDYDKKYFQATKIKTFKRQVYQMDNNDGNIIKIWDSIIDAARELGIQQSDISHCLSGKYRIAGGFGWCTEDTLNKFKPYKRERTILQFDKNRNFIKEWNSAKEAADFLNKDGNNIRAAAKGKRKTAYGYIWKYKEG